MDENNSKFVKRGISVSTQDFEYLNRYKINKSKFIRQAIDAVMKGEIEIKAKPYKSMLVYIHNEGDEYMLKNRINKSSFLKQMVTMHREGKFEYKEE